MNEEFKTTSICRGCPKHGQWCSFFASHGREEVLKCRWEVMISEEERIERREW